METEYNLFVDGKLEYSGLESISAHSMMESVFVERNYQSEIRIETLDMKYSKVFEPQFILEVSNA